LRRICGGDSGCGMQQSLGNVLSYQNMGFARP
jgi:hypothetical protein